MTTLSDRNTGTTYRDISGIFTNVGVGIEEARAMATPRATRSAPVEVREDTVPKTTLAWVPPGAGMTYPTEVDTATVMMTDNLRAQLIKMEKEAVKADAGKPDWSLVPFEALEGMTQVLMFGAKKYDNWNWTTGGGFEWVRVLSSCLRHLFAWAKGEDNDPESGLSHISHAQCNLLFLAFYIRNKDKFSKDNRNVRQ